MRRTQIGEKKMSNPEKQINDNVKSKIKRFEEKKTA